MFNTDGIFMVQKTLERVYEKISKKFTAIDHEREYAYSTHREIIKYSSLAIRSAHRKQFEEAAEFLKKSKELIEEVKKRLSCFPEIYFAGFVHDAQKEFAEANITYAIIKDQSLPDPDSIGVDYPAYLNGLGESVGELRRFVLDAIRHKEHQDYENVLSVMDEIYYLLTSVDYPDAITKGLRRTTDVARSIIEKTRGDLTTHFIIKGVRS